MVTWLSVVPAVAVACIAIVGPGLLMTAPLRFGLVARLAISALAGVFATGVAAMIFGALGMAFSFWQVLIIAVLGLALAWSVRRAIPRIEDRPTRRSWWLLLVWVGAVTAFAVMTFASVPSPERISQTYDNVFHLSAVTAVTDGFSASPLTFRSLIETGNGGLAYYPSTWHALAALTAEFAGVPIPVAFNALWIAVVSVAWLPAIAWLSALVTRSRLAPLIALPLGVSMGWFPYALLTWGTIYPTALAHSLLPAAVGLGVLATRAAVPRDVFTRSPGGRTQTSRYVLAVAAVLLAACAIAFAHPRVIPTWVLIVAPYTIWSIVRAFRFAKHTGGAAARRARRVMLAGTGAVVLVACAALWVAVTRLGLLAEPLSDRLNGPQARATQTIGEGIVQVILLQARTGVGGIITGAAPLLAAVVVVGVVVAVRRADTRWLVISYVFFAILFVLAAGADDDITKLLTGIWYKDGYRLAAALPVLAVPLATLGVVALGGLATRAMRSRVQAQAFAAIAVSVAISAVSVVTLGATGVSAATGIVFHQPTAAANREIVSTKQIAFLRDVVPEIVPEDQRLLGDPWDGSALSGLYAGREPVFPHVNGQWDRQRRVLAWLLEGIESDPEVCASLDGLRVRYLVYNPHSFGGGDPAGNHFPAPHAAAEAGLFRAVATDGESILFRIDQCGPLG